MDFIELINKRRACHDFIPNRKIEIELLKDLVKQAALSPSGYNAQPWEFLIVTETERIGKLHEIAFGQDHVKNASALVFVLADCEIGRNVDKLAQDWLDYGYLKEEKIESFKGSLGKVRDFEQRKMMALRNAMLAAMTFILAAENAGLATCPMMGFSKWQADKFLEIPEDRVIALMIALGYQGEKEVLPRLPRKDVKELIYWEKFQS
jgi:nitroreductase